MLKHHEIWAALDRLAAEHGLTPSGLARRAGLDPTTFNRSKRITRDGKLRWPSTESLSKVLEATGSTLAHLVRLTGRPEATSRLRIPLLGYAEAGEPGSFDTEGKPSGTGWRNIEFPARDNDPVFALEVSGDSMEPAYRAGDILLVAPAAIVEIGHRVVVKLAKGDLLVKQLGERTAGHVELIALNPDHPNLRFTRSEITWMARVIWTSQ